MNRRHFLKRVVATVAAGTAAVVAPSVGRGSGKDIGPCPCPKCVGFRGRRSGYIITAYDPTTQLATSTSYI
jgi:hypothetical protein